MPALLCSLGTSWAVVPEAFHLLPSGPDGFSAVHVLTSDSPKTDEAAQKVHDYFGARHPGVTLTIAHVAGFSDLRLVYRLLTIVHRGPSAATSHGQL